MDIDYYNTEWDDAYEGLLRLLLDQGVADDELLQRVDELMTELWEAPNATNP